MTQKLSEYRWRAADKAMLMKMVAIGCGWRAIAVQIGRTPAACNAMYHLMIKKNEPASKRSSSRANGSGD
jgi:hypothetical protein